MLQTKLKGAICRPQVRGSGFNYAVDASCPPQEYAVASFATKTRVSQQCHRHNQGASSSPVGASFAAR